MSDRKEPAETEFGRSLLRRMGHVARLYGDAALLLKHNRVAGSALIAALAYEELGKLIHFVWKEWGIEPKGYTRNAHDRKQRAVACLLIVADLYPHASDMVYKGRTNDSDLQSMAASLLHTKRQKSTFWVIMGGLEKFKHLAMYIDETNEDTGVDAFAIRPEHVEAVLEVLDPALDHLRDPRLLRASAVVWEQAGLLLEGLKSAGLRYFDDISPLDASV